MTKRIISLLLALVMVLSLLPASVLAAGHTIASAGQLPTAIAEGETYLLTADITLAAGQQIETLAGTLDGQGHTITLADKPLAKSVSGLIQNLGVTGAITSSETFGSIAETLSGTVQACFSTASVTLEGWMGDVGGLVGTLDGGTVQNCYFAGTVAPSFMGAGLIATCYNEASTVKNCVYTAGVSAIAMNGGKISADTCQQLSESDLRSGTALTLLNTGLPATGYVWAMPTGGGNDGFPVLAQSTGPVEVSKAALEAAIARAEALNEADYTAETWRAVAEALEAARQVLAKQDATQQEVNEAAAALNGAIDALRAKTPTAPIAPPEDAAQIHHIKTVDDLSQGIAAGEYWVLDNDLTIAPSDWYFAGACAGVLDGQGHTVTYNGVSYGTLFTDISGVVQNVHFTGSIAGYQLYGGACRNLSGAILNCYSDVTGDYACGLARRMQDSAVIANCYSISSGKGGALINEYAEGCTGVVQNSYWLDTLDNSALPASALQNACAMEQADMQSLRLVELLNQNRGAYGVSWGQNGQTGYPYFGENQPFQPEDEPLPENKYPVTFTPYDSSEALPVEHQALTLSPDEVQALGKIAGTFHLTGLPEDSTIEWGFYRAPEPEDCMLIGADTGAVSVYADGEAVIAATEIRPDGSREQVSFVKITAKTRTIESIRLWLDDTDVTSGHATVAGSEHKTLRLTARYVGEEQDIPVASSRFTFTVSDESLIENLSGATFRFLRPGTGTITAAYTGDAAITASVSLTSTFVPVTSVEPDLSGERVLHGRNANSDGGRAFNPEYTSVRVEPANASNRDRFTITSSDPSVAEYVPSMVRGYVAYRAGTVTFTASIADTDEASGYHNTVSGTSTVTYRYQNPLTSVTAGSANVETEVGKSAALSLRFEGSLSAEGYSVTEPELVWAYSTPGIVSIDREAAYGWKRDEAAPDNNCYLPLTDYTVHGISDGTVTATGTPVDQSGGAKPVVLTITVRQGNTPAPDCVALAQAAETSAHAFTARDELSYNDEWLVYAAERSGRSLSDSQRTAYISAATSQIQTWDASHKPTDFERVALALSILGEDITDVGGVNLAERIYNHEKLTRGCNELIYGLLALDARRTPIPASAKWSRTAMIEALLSFQNDDGGFGLYAGGPSGVDTTAMALQALAPYRQQQASIDRALDYLRSQGSVTCDFGSAEATAQVLLALTALNLDPLNTAGLGTRYNNTVTALAAYDTGAGFVHTIGGKANRMASLQAWEAMTAYLRYVNGQTTYWNLYQPITVTVSVIGDTIHGTEPHEAYVPWIDPQPIELNAGSSAADAISAVLTANGYTCVGLESNYITSLTTPEGETLAEFTNGQFSGWMYKVNEVNPPVGVKDYALQEGDAVVLFYTCDYRENFEHTWDEGVVTTEPTCTESGVMTFTCQDIWCGGYTRTEEIPALGHNYTATVVPPTCTEQGYTLHTCSRCQDTYRDTEVSALGHTEVIDPAVAPTCVDAGLTEGKHCSVCQTVLVKQETVAALGHDWDGGKVTTEPTAQTEGIKTFTCTRCGETRTEPIPALGEQPCDGGDGCPGKAFTDMPAASNWAHKGIDYVVANGIFKGNTDGTFGPGNPMNRAMLVTTLYRLAGEPAPKAAAAFSDVDAAHYYAKPVAWAAENGIVNGMGDNKFQPNTNVTREQAATFLYRYAAYAKLDTTARADLSKFPDADKVSNFAKDSLAWANAEGLINGKKNTETGVISLAPKGSATRAELAKILMNFMENVVK